MTSPTRLGGEAAEHEGGRAPVRRRRDPEGGRADRGQTYGYRELKAGSGAQSGGADNGERDVGENGQGTPGGADPGEVDQLSLSVALAHRAPAHPDGHERHDQHPR